MMITFLDYLAANMTNFWWALFVWVTFLSITLMLTLGFIVAAIKLIIKEYFSWLYQYEKAQKTKED